MNRRGFLASLGAFASAAVLDPERALWVRGAKTISVPRPLALPSDWGRVWVLRDYDPQRDMFTTRIDVMFGMTAVEPWTGLLVSA